MSGEEDPPDPAAGGGGDPPENRRSERRRRRFEVPWLQSARIKYGPNVEVQDVSASGLRFRCDQHLAPNTNTVLELTGPHGTTLVPARVVRVHRVTTRGFAWYEIACRLKRTNALDELFRSAGPPKK